MLLVGLTGGIASGKSLVARMFEQEGAYIIDLDSIGRKIVCPGTAGWKEVLTFFGAEVLNEDGTLNRKELGSIVFSDPEKRKILENILHPKIYQEQVHQVEEIVSKDDRAVVIVDIPLLIEVKKQEAFDRVVLVFVSPEIQLERLVKRDGFSPDEARKRLEVQMAIESKRKYAHYIIENGGALERTQQQVKAMFQALRRVESKKRPAIPQ